MRSAAQFPNLPLYNRSVLKSVPVILILLAVMAGGQQRHPQPLPVLHAAAVQQPPAGQQPGGQPQIQLNYLNVCTPSADEQATLKSALAKVSGAPSFAEDFEVSRGSATVKDAPASKYVRLRREFPSQSPLMTAQYSVSLDDKVTVETLVLRMRDPKEFHEISFEDRVSVGAATPVGVVAMDTPASRIRIERLGKGSVVLSRCPGADQSVYEPLFKQASDLMARYRAAMGLRTAFHPDIAWLEGGSRPRSQQHRQKQP